MTREEIKELLPIIQAFAEGKQIQDKIEGLTSWVDTDEINLEYYGQKLKHRIKPGQKFDPKTLKPFDKVLFRDSIDRAWTCGIFSHANFEFFHPFKVGSCSYKWCIPYNEDTRHIVGSKEDAPEYYRYWED